MINRKLVLEILFYLVLFTVLFIVFSAFDLFESFYNYSRLHENNNIDEVIFVVPALMLCFAVLSYNKIRILNKTNRRLYDINNELIEAKGQIQKYARAKDEFIAMACHELRNPLGFIIGTLSVAVEEEQEARECTDLAKNAAEDLNMLLEDILEFSRIKYDQQSVSRRSFNLNETLQRIERLVRQQCKLKGLDFSIEIDQDVPQFVTSHPGWIRLITLNILGNAIKFTEQGSINLHCGYSERRKALVITVTDTGTGIAQDKQGVIFQPFKQEDGSSSGKGGIGLGLYVVNELIRKMNAEIRVESRLGAGSMFAMFFPVEEFSER